MGGRRQGRRHEVRGLHHQAPRRILHVRHAADRLQDHRARHRLPRPPQSRRRQAHLRRLPRRGNVGRRLLQQARLAPRLLLVAALPSARPQPQLRPQPLPRPLGGLRPVHARPNRGADDPIRPHRHPVAGRRLGAGDDRRGGRRLPRAPRLAQAAGAEPGHPDGRAGGDGAATPARPDRGRPGGARAESELPHTREPRARARAALPVGELHHLRRRLGAHAWREVHEPARGRAPAGRYRRQGRQPAAQRRADPGRPLAGRRLRTAGGHGGLDGGQLRRHLPLAGAAALQAGGRRGARRRRRRGLCHRARRRG